MQGGGVNRHIWEETMKDLIDTIKTEHLAELRQVALDCCAVVSN